MHNSPQAVPGPAGRFFLSVAAGLLAPFTALIVLALLLGGVVPPADLLYVPQIYHSQISRK